MTTSLGFRLSVVLGIALSIGLAAFLYTSMAHHEAALLALKREEATILSDAIKGSLTHAMSQGKAGRDAIHRAIEDVSAREEIERVRIFNAVGLIQYSSDPTEMGKVVDKEAENCKQCHSSEEPQALRGISDRSRFYYTPSRAESSRYRVLGLINPIYNERDRNCTACHQDQMVLGVLDVVVSLKNLDEEIAGHRSTLWLFGILGVGAILGCAALLVHFMVHRPVAELLDGTKKVGLLDLDYRIPADRNDELGNLARAFNQMTERLQRAREEIRDFADHLEHKVEEKTEELQATQSRMLHTEKMAAIGQMAAGVAHEINNPLTGVITFAHLLRKKMEPGSRDQEDLDTIIEAAQRCSKIVRGLLDFARSGELAKTRIEPAGALDRVLALLEPQAAFHDIEVVREYAPDLPLVNADSDRVSQVFLNLVVNAVEAMDGRGKLTLRIRADRGEGDRPEVVVEIEDAGPGIPEEVRSRIFDPFFTTKEAGSGTGLGLSVSYRIIADHGGQIRVRPAPVRGTVFSVHLPVESGR